MSRFDDLLVIGTILFGFFVNVRIGDDLRAQKILSKSAFQYVMWFYFGIVVVISLFETLSPLKSATIVALNVLCFLIFEKYTKKKLKNDFLLMEIRFIRHTHLKISSGKGLIDAILEQIEQKDSKYFEFYEFIVHFVTFRQQNVHAKLDKRQKKFADWLIKLIDDPVNAREKLRSLEERLQIEHDFRRRSGQALLNVKIQALIMIGIYILASLFVIFNYGFLQNWKYFGISLALFSVGLIWVLNLGKSIKWKV